MEDENINKLDGGPEYTNIYYSQCIKCVHLSDDIETCPAFPNGIPNSILYEMGKHDHVLPGQTGNFIYKENI